MVVSRKPWCARTGMANNDGIHCAAEACALDGNTYLLRLRSHTPRQQKYNDTP
jgi:hypothetical protein